MRGELANVIDMRVLVPRVLGALEDSRRITHASVYLADPDGSGYELTGHVGPKPEGRFDAITHRAFFERLRRTGVITLEGIEREVAAHRPVSTEEQESLQLMLRTLEQMYGSVALGFSSEDQLLGALVIRDDRLREAYSTDEIEIFRGVATTIGITLQNSQVYERMKERDRLAALGQMAAGLAHEIRNPLGSIKGAAQFLQPAQDGGKRRQPRVARDAGGDPGIPRHHRRGGEPPQQDRLAVPRLRAPLPRRAAAAGGRRRAQEDPLPAPQGQGDARSKAPSRS